MTASAEQFVASARELPVMPPVAAEIIKRAENPDTEISSLVSLISKDAALAVRVLRIANSSFYSASRRIETLQQAIVLLGYSTLRSIVIAASMKDVFARFGLAERLLWEHSVGAAVAATVLARAVGGLAREEAFVGGLVHDIGKLLLHAEAESDYQEVMRAVYAEDREAIEVEQEVFGFDHTEVGELILARWKLSPKLAAAVGAHHDLDKADAVDGARPLAAVLQVADRLCLREGLGRRKPRPELDPLDCPGAALLGLGAADVEDLVAEFREAYEREREALA